MSGSSKYDHITPVLKELHWLPIKERIQFKTLVITFKALNGQAPEYLSELLCRKVNTRLLRSSNEILLDIPKFKLKAYGQNAFCVSAPCLWNSLPNVVRNCTSINAFNKSLKTFLFRKAFNC